MRTAIARGATLSVVVNLALWFAASLVGVVPAAVDSVPTVVTVAFFSAAGVVAAGIVANRFLGTGARTRWDRLALGILVLSFSSPIGLALGAIPVSQVDPTNALLLSHKVGIAAMYAVLHLTTYLVVQRTVAEEIPA
jgi:hypothetical protein